MANLLACEIVTPECVLFNGNVVLVVAPGSEGDVGMMYQCSPLMSTLRRGVIQIRQENDELTSIAVDAGYLEVDGRKAIILALRAINVAEIDKSNCKQMIEENEKRLIELEDGNPAKAYAKEEIAWLSHLMAL